MDKFYTNLDIAKKCMEYVKDTVPDYPDNFDIILEPSAGSGSFLNLFPEEKRKGIDIQPENPEIKKMDFIEEFMPIENTRYAVIGNPPFGKVSSLAIKFFNRAAEFADIIAFIVPRTFKRISVQNSLDLNMKLIFSEDLPPGKESFSPPMNAKCCFQIWKKIKEKEPKRQKVVLPIKSADFEFLKLGPIDSSGQPTVPKNAEIAVRAYGGNCGDIVSGSAEMGVLRPKSWHWLKSVKGGPSVAELISIIQKMDFSISRDTVRQNSIGKAEFVFEYNLAKMN